MYFQGICNYRLKLFKMHLSNLSWCECRELDLIVQKMVFSKRVLPETCHFVKIQSYTNV